MEFRSHALQFQHFIIQFLPGSAVTAHHPASMLQQQPGQRSVAYAQPQHPHSLALQGVKIFIKPVFHIRSSLPSRGISPHLPVFSISS